MCTDTDGISAGLGWWVILCIIYSWGFTNLILHVFWVYSSLIWEVKAFTVRTLGRVTLVTQQKPRRGAWFHNRDVPVRAITCWMLITVLCRDNVLKIRFFLKGIISLILNCCVAFPGQLVVCTLCSCVMKTKQIWLFSAHMLPLLARLCLVPLETIVIINKFAMIFTGLEVLYFLASNLLVPYNLAKSAYRELVQVRL